MQLPKVEPWQKGQISNTFKKAMKLPNWYQFANSTQHEDDLASINACLDDLGALAAKHNEQ